MTDDPAAQPRSPRILADMSRRRPWLASLLALVWAVLCYREWVRPWMYGWGATSHELSAGLPGDDLVAPGCLRSTRAITIDAPAECVWPWLAQIGEDRGGFYSYDILERLAGADIHNADVIHPEWQNLHVGDTVWLARRYGERACQVVAELVPNSHLVLVSAADDERVRRGLRADGAWAFHLKAHGDRTRLIVRGCGGAVGRPAFDVAHFIMEQKMMRGLRRRAERMWSESSADRVRGLPDCLPVATATP